MRTAQLRPVSAGKPSGRGVGLSLQNVSRHYAGRPVIDRLNLTIHPGEFIALLGPSGCGKSTLLRLLAGLDSPDAGHLERPSPAPRLAYVFQDASLMPWRTVLANVELPLELAGVPRIERQATARNWLDTVGLAEAADRYPGELSGGMKMRVSLARALITQPDLLLLDEPFAALDELTRQRLDEQLQQLWLARQMTVVFVTHSISEAVYLADRIVLLGPHGAGVLADESITLPRPRSSACRFTADYTAWVKHLSDQLARSA